MGTRQSHVAAEAIRALRDAAMDRKPIRRLTHCFYWHRARFSPASAGTPIEAFSRPGQLALDPCMGGETTIFEAVARGRRPIAKDLNSVGLGRVDLEMNFRFVIRQLRTCNAITADWGPDFHEPKAGT